MGKLHAAVDVGGTFTDLIVADLARGELAVAKVPSARRQLGADILHVIELLAKHLGASIADVDSVILGTTVVTNSILEGEFARTALIATEGFRDVLEIGRMERASSYDFARRRPRPIAPRHLRFEVRERLNTDGEVIHGLNVEDAMALVQELRDRRVESVAICLLFSYANPIHESVLGEILRRELEIPVSLSSEVLPVFREFERTSTTVINAATIPVMVEFVDGLDPVLNAVGHRVFIMGSEGGCVTLQEARRQPAASVMSGPAGGVMGGARLAMRYGFDGVLTLDVGGTSTDVALIQRGRIPYTGARKVGGHTIALPSIEVETVGAGGGSIAFADRAGLLKVGPASAGADPGPICYRRGGVRPTLTDAHLALGRLGERTMLGGEFLIDAAAAVDGISDHLARPLGISWVRAALGILQVATANIVRAVRAISVERGHDPRQLTLVAFGGAGPLHALDVARALEIPRVLVPRYPGLWSAYGILLSDIQYSAYRTWYRRLYDLEPADLRRSLSDLKQALLAKARSDGLDTREAEIKFALDLRYRGQSFELTIPLDGQHSTPDHVALAFHEEHERRYGHAAPGEVVELVNLRVHVAIPRKVTDRSLREDSLVTKSLDKRHVWFDAVEPILCPVFRREELRPGEVLTGPAIVEQYDSVVVLNTGDRLEVMSDGQSLVASVRPLVAGRVS